MDELEREHPTFFPNLNFKFSRKSRMSLLEFAKNNKEYLTLFNKLTDNQTSIRSSTIQKIIKHLNDENDKINNNDELSSNPLIKYTLQRLIRGLTSSKHANRIAFANAFSQV